MNSNRDLTDLGWGPWFEKQVTPEEREACLLGRVAAVHKYSFGLAGGAGPVRAVMAGRELHGPEATADLPVVGDWVVAKPPVGGTAVLVRRLERRSELARRQPLDRQSFKTSSERQVLAANLDLVFIVMSLNQDLNPARLERALVLVWNSGATPVVLLSKADLCPDVPAATADIRNAAGAAEVLVISSVSGAGLPEVRRYLTPGRTGCLLGSSGAGKTTLINALCGTSAKTLDIRDDDDKGRHATTTRSLFVLPEGGMLIDTPGLREIGLLDDQDLTAAFTDIAELAINCRYADCTHRVEPGCAVQDAVSAGRLGRERYENYLKLCRELDYQASKHTVSGRLEIKKKQKQLGKSIKDYFKNR